MDSPESDSTESACCDIDGEDPNDPEWTVADDRDTEKEKIRPTAKRQDKTLNKYSMSTSSLLYTEATCQLLYIPVGHVTCTLS